jgi:hypothetical protein
MEPEYDIQETLSESSHGKSASLPPWPAEGDDSFEHVNNFHRQHPAMHPVGQAGNPTSFANHPTNRPNNTTTNQPMGNNMGNNTDNPMGNPMGNPMSNHMGNHMGNTMSNNMNNSMHHAPTHLDQPSRRQREVVSERQYQERQALLHELRRLEMSGVKLTKEFTMADSIESMEFELERHNMASETSTNVDMMSDGIKMVLSAIEMMNRKYGKGVVNLNGWSSNLTKDMHRFRGPLSRIYKRVWRRGMRPSPFVELGMLILGSAFVHHFSNNSSGGLMSAGIGGLGAMLGTGGTGFAGGTAPTHTTYSKPQTVPFDVPPSRNARPPMQRPSTTRSSTFEKNGRSHDQAIQSMPSAVDAMNELRNRKNNTNVVPVETRLSDEISDDSSASDMYDEEQKSSKNVEIDTISVATSRSEKSTRSLKLTI